MRARAAFVDAWGNAEDGWEENDYTHTTSWREIPDGADIETIARILEIKPGLRHMWDESDDMSPVLIHERTAEPIIRVFIEEGA